MITQELSTKINEVIAQTSMKLLGKVLDVQVVFRANMRTTAALAYRGIDKIEINTKLLLANIDKFLTVLIPHEICHLVQHYLFPDAKRPHGKEFKHLMNSIGLAGDTYHDLDVSNKFTYACACQEFKIDLQFHKRIQSGKKICCKKCKTLISLV